MLRRFSLLAVLLLTLSVIAPAVFACDSDDACCPDQGMPCEQGGQEEAAACCGEQPIQAVISTTARELEALDLRLPHGAAALPAEQPRRLYSICLNAVELTQNPSNQRQLYLHTGRLRL